MSEALGMPLRAWRHDRLEVRVEDDGRGGATIRSGSGLAAIQDRVAATGGSLVLHSPTGRGTVEAVLQCEL